MQSTIQNSEQRRTDLAACLTTAVTWQNERNKLIHGRFTYSEVTRDYELRSKNDWIASDAEGIGKLISDLHDLMSHIDSEAISLVKMVQHRRTESTFKGFGVL
jgi:hypothetical protein